MVAIPCQIARIFRAKHKQRVKIGIVERVLGPLQTFPQHPLRIKSHFPIDRNHSNIRHNVFLLENKVHTSLALLAGACQICGP